MTKRAIQMPNWIGDFIMALSVIRMQPYDSTTSITLIIPKKLAALAASVSSFPCIIFDKTNRHNFKESIARIKKENFDETILLPHSFSSAWLAFRCKIPHRRGVNAELRRFLLTDPVSKSVATRTHHLTAEYSHLLKSNFIEPENVPCSRIKPVLTPNTPIVLCIGAAFGPAKQWSGFVELVKLLPDLHFDIIGDKQDTTLGNLIAAIDPRRITNKAGCTTLGEAISILASSPLVISNDSGLMHVAAFLGVPVIGLFGSTSPHWTRPLGKNATLFLATVSCTPCYKRECSLNTPYACMHSITPHKVATRVKEILCLIKSA